MRIAVSNLAWDPDLDDEVGALLVGLGVQGVELAPTKRWSDPTAVGSEAAAAERAAWEQRGLPVVALQSLLFGRPDLTVFGDGVSVSGLVDHLGRIARLGGWLGAGPLVFGSPKNRLRGDRPLEQAMEEASSVFAAAAESAAASGTCLCIEPNPPDYGCDFVTRAEEGAALVRRVDHPGFGLHLDTGSMTLAGDDLGPSVLAGADVLRHFHASEPGLAPAGSTGQVDHGGAAEALRRSGYDGWVSIEMLVPGDDPLPVIERAVGFVVETYGG
ncbi:MAG: TIM barrel protein [Acidimicrobiales bacterium]